MTAMKWLSRFNVWIGPFAIIGACALVGSDAQALSLYCTLAQVDTWQGTITVTGSLNFHEDQGGLWINQTGSSTYQATYTFPNPIGRTDCDNDPEYSPPAGAKFTSTGSIVAGSESGSGQMASEDNYCEGLELGVTNKESTKTVAGAPATNGSIPQLHLDLGKNTYSFSSLGGAELSAIIDYKNCAGTEGTHDGTMAVGLPSPINPTNISLGATTSIVGAADLAADRWRYQVEWNLQPVALRAHVFKNDTIDDPCKKKGSIISCENQSLGETIQVTGTPFALHYRSDRVAGRLRADAVGVALAKDLGGWTLTPYHRYDPVENKLLLGNGERHDSAALGTVRRSPAGGYLIACDAGDQVYEFGADGTHLRTRHVLTGAVLYQFTTNAGHLAAITDANGNITTIQRDANGFPTAIIAPFGQVTRLATDANGYLAQVVNPAGGAVWLQSTPDGLLTRFTRPSGLGSSFEYDAEGRLSRDIGPDGSIQTLNREGTSILDFAVTHTSAEGKITQYQVKRDNGGGDDKTITDAAGLITTTSRGASVSYRMPDGSTAGAQLGEDPRFGRTESFAASFHETQANTAMMSFGKRTATLGNASDPFSLVEQTETLTINGLPEGVDLPPGMPPMPGRTYSKRYTAADRTLVVTTPRGQATHVVLNQQGRPTQSQVGNLAPRTLTYDTRGRLARVSTGSGGDEQSVSIGYDASGWLSSVTDSLGRSTQFTRDALGQVIRQQLPGGRMLRFAYDADSHITMLTVPSGAMHRFSYGSNGLLAAYAAPGVLGTKTITRYGYDRDRDLVQIVRPDGTQVNFTYDTAGRVSSTATPQGDYRYAYLATTGSLSAIDSPSGIHSEYSYDGALLTAETWSGAVAGSIGMTYDNEFRIQETTLNGADPIALAYDSDGHLSAIGGLALTRDAGTGLLTGSKLGVVEDHFDYDQFGRVIRYQASVQGVELLSRAYTYDSIGRIVGVSETSGQATTRYGYGYDSAGRLSQVTNDHGVAASYQYDANGNINRAERGGELIIGSYDAQDRLRRFGDATYAYTDAGDLKTKTQGSQVTQYGYDTQGNLLKVALPSGDTIEYLVDGADRRVGEKRNGTLVRGLLYLDQLKPAAELDGQGNVVGRFVYATHANVPDYMIKGGHVYRIVTDQIGSPRLVVDAADGTVAQSIAYDEWGRVVADSNPGFQPFGFAGGLYDSDTGLVRFGAREYLPSTGRWTSKDPILFHGGDANLYSYVLNDPLNKTDPAGFGSDFIDEKTLQAIEETIRDIQSTFKVTWEKAVKMYWEADAIKSSGRANGRPGVKGWKPGGWPMLVIIVCGPELMEEIRKDACYSGKGPCTSVDLTM